MRRSGRRDAVKLFAPPIVFPSRGMDDRHGAGPETQGCGRPRSRVVGLAPLFAGTSVRLSKWRCPAQRERERRTPERAKEWPTIVFLQAGTTLVHSPRSPGLLDCTRVGFHDAGVPFQSTHPHGGGDHGTELEIQPDALVEILAGHGRRHGGRESALFRAGSGPCPPEAFLLVGVLARRLERRAVRRPDLPREEPRAEALEVEELGLRLADVLAAAAHGEETRRLASPRRDERARAGALLGILASRPGCRHHLDALAAETGSSPFQLCRSFRSVTGTTIHRHLTTLRLLNAIERLADGCRDITGLAFDLGFSSHSHFTAVFRSRLGVTPESVRALASCGDLGALQRSVVEPAASA
jgi:AraC-like DNA-binding protein